MQDCNSIKTPLPEKLDYNALQSNEFYTDKCQKLLGSLLYLMTCTRPDISYAINVLSRFASKNNKAVWQYLWGILRYLKGTASLKLTYERNLNDECRILIGYADADHAGDKSDLRSTSGYVFKMYENCSITWSTRKQAPTATSTTVAEYIAMYEAVKEAVWLRSLSITLSLEVKTVLIWEDNKSCIAIAENPGNHGKTKHVDIKYHYTREQVEIETVELKHVRSSEQIADIFTKPLGAEKFCYFRTMLGIQ